MALPASYKRPETITDCGLELSLLKLWEGQQETLLGHKVLHPLHGRLQVLNMCKINPIFLKDIRFCCALIFPVETQPWVNAWNPWNLATACQRLQVVQNIHNHMVIADSHLSRIYRECCQCQMDCCRKPSSLCQLLANAPCMLPSVILMVMDGMWSHEFNGCLSSDKYFLSACSCFTSALCTRKSHMPVSLFSVSVDRLQCLNKKEHYLQVVVNLCFSFALCQVKHLQCYTRCCQGFPLPWTGNCEVQGWGLCLVTSAKG